MIQTSYIGSGNATILQAAALLWMARTCWEFVKRDIIKKDPVESVAVNRLAAKVDDMSGEIIKLRVALIGINGNNGISSDVRTLRDRMHSMEGAVALLSGIATANQSRLSEIERHKNDHKVECSNWRDK